MTIILIWLLSLTPSSVGTSGQNHNFTNLTTGEVKGINFTYGHLTTQEASSVNIHSKVSGRNITPSIKAHVNPTKEKTAKPITKPSWQKTHTMSSKTFLTVNQKTATLADSISAQLNSLTRGMKSIRDIHFQVTTSVTTVLTFQTSNPTTNISITPMLSSSTQGLDTRKTSTIQLTSDKMTNPATHPAQSTQLISTATTSTQPADKSRNTSPVTGGDVTHSTGLYKTSPAITYTPFIHMTKAKKRQEPPTKKEESYKGTNHGKAVAGVIVGALLLMLVGFLVIFIKKRKLQRQQITTTDWAGPSPFLEGAVENGYSTLRSPNQISLISFLPQRQSKRLSLLPETDEELEDVSPGTTFGDKCRGNTFCQQVEGSYVQQTNGTSVVASEMKSTGDVPEKVENSVFGEVTETNNPLYRINNSEAANQSQETAHPPTLSEDVENAPTQLNDGPGQP